MARALINKSLELSPEMAAFMGTNKATRGDVTKEIWKYLKKQDLKKPSGGWEFDDTLEAVLHARGMKKPSDLFALLKKSKAFVA